MSIGTRIRTARKQRNMTQAELAQRCGVTKNAISNYENDVSTPDATRLSLIMEALEVDPNYIYQDFVVASSLDNSNRELLTTEELEVIYKYRQADDKTKKIVKAALDLE